jgi:hypothetical protein
MTTSRQPAPTLLLLAGAATDGLALLTQLARALGHQIVPSGGESLGNRLGGWFGTGDRVALPDTRLEHNIGRYAEAADRLGAAFPVILVVDHPTAPSGKAGREAVFAWLEGVLGAAHATRLRSRSVILAEDLADDWQAALSRADKQSGSRLMAAATLAEIDDADDLLHSWPAAPQPDWGRLDVPPTLRDLAARSYAAICSVAQDQGDLDFVDTLWAEYAAEFRTAS